MNCRRSFALGSGAFVALAACGGTQDFVKPIPPDMAELVKSYEEPDGSFDEGDLETTALLAGTAGALVEVLGSTELAPQFSELLDTFVAPLTPSNSDDSEDADGSSGSSGGIGGLNGLSIRADGYALITRICPGWTLPVRVDRDNGEIRAQATFTQDGPDPVFWGTVDNCRYRVGENRIELRPHAGEDSIKLYWGGALQRGAVGPRDLIFSLRLGVELNGTDIDLDSDFRYLQGGVFEFLLPVESGTMVVRVQGDGTFLLRSREGTFGCNTDFECNLEPADAN